MDSSDNDIFKLVGGPLLLKTQFGFALASWHARYGGQIADWLLALGEMEALCSLAGYAGEHPEDVFPELVFDSDTPSIAAQGLAHPLIAESRSVRNDLRLDSNQPFHVISGSNMSGKSTWLRAIGTNLVLALAGAPVRARAFRMTPLQIGASIRTVDSLQEGISRFYAEIKRLRQLVQMADRPERLIFLIDEVLSGTNSHDRQIGAAFIVKALVARKAVGLITTHDLALTQVADQVAPPGVNFHFEDQLVGDKLSFDYQLQPGVVKKSNALALMRSIGLEVEPGNQKLET
jgi:DNA mismatch repair ATPase MutS